MVSTPAYAWQMESPPVHAHLLSTAPMPGKWQAHPLKRTRSALHTCLTNGKRTGSHALAQHSHAGQTASTSAHTHRLSTEPMPAKWEAHPLTRTRSALHHAGQTVRAKPGKPTHAHPLNKKTAVLWARQPGAGGALALFCVSALLFVVWPTPGSLPVIACLLICLLACLLACVLACPLSCWLVCVRVCLFACLLVCLLVWFGLVWSGLVWSGLVWFGCLFVCLFVCCLFVCLFVVCLFVLFVCLFVCLFVLFNYVFVCLGV